MPKYTKAAQARTGNRKLNQGRGSTKKVPPAVPVAKGLPKTLARKKR